MTDTHAQRILSTFMTLAREHGLYAVTATHLQAATNTKRGSFWFYVRSMDDLRASAVAADPALGPLHGAAAERDEQILQAATALAREHGLYAVTRRMIAEHVGMAEGTISNYGYERPSSDRVGPVMPRIRDDVMGVAIEQRLLPIIAQGIAAGDPIARSAPIELREAVATMVAA